VRGKEENRSPSAHAEEVETVFM